MYVDRAVQFDPNGYPNGFDNPIALMDFIAAAVDECHGFLPHDWYLKTYHQETRTIVVGLERYEDSIGLQPIWNFVLTADPLEEDDTQWVVFDVVRYDPQSLYSFQIPE